MSDDYVLIYIALIAISILLVMWDIGSFETQRSLKLGVGLLLILLGTWLYCSTLSNNISLQTRL